MSVKTILVCLTDEPSAQSAMACAVAIARTHGAHLIGLHVMEAPILYPGIAMHIPEAALAAFSQSQKDLADGIKAVFERHTHAEDFPSEWRLVKGDARSVVDRIIESARPADLVVMPNATTGFDQSDHVQAKVIREAGRPVIIAPTHFSGDTVGTKIVVGWSDTREATRAAHDVLQLAKAGSEVAILRVSDEAADELHDFKMVELAALFDRHGLSVETVRRDPQGKEVAETLLQFAFETGTDLIATGAYGHSRAYDFVIGSMTRGLLRQAKLPVLFST